MTSRVCSEVLLANIFLNFKNFTFVHKSIEKTQKFKYFQGFFAWFMQ
jgi:hypothetical protein